MLNGNRIKALVTRGIAVMGCLLLTACGGGDTVQRGDPAPGTPDPGNSQPHTITLSLTSITSGNADNQLSGTNPLTLTANVTDSSGAAVTDILVTFSFSIQGLATFSNDTGTALTGSANSGVPGQAQIGLEVGERAGDGLVIATLASGEQAQIGFSSAGTQAAVPASLDFFASATQMASSGSDTVELIAVVKNSQSVLLQGVDVRFSAPAEANAEIQVTRGTTGADGTARALLSTRNNQQNRIIELTASAGQFSHTLQVEVVGTSIDINGPASVILGDTASYTLVLQDSDGKGIANQPLVFSSELGNSLSDSSPVTDQTGQVTISYTATQSGSDTLLAEGLNASGSLDVTVQEDAFGFSLIPGDDIALGTNGAFTVNWMRQGAPLVGGNLTLTSTRGSLSSNAGVTDANGNFSFSLSSTNAGPALVNVEGIDGSGARVNARAEVYFIATRVDNIQLTASPASIGPDGQKSTITAVLRDPQGNLVKGKTVNFTLDDVSGGSINPASAITNTNGLASTVYTSNDVSQQDGVTISASEDSSGLVNDTHLTVAKRELFISIGTGNSIRLLGDTSYEKDFTLFVTDANANPVAGVNLTVSGTPVKYTDLINPHDPASDIRPAFYKGYWVPTPSLEEFKVWAPVQTVACANEDIDGDGLLDPGEDENGDGELTPGNVAAVDGNVTTDANGQAIFTLRYPKNYAAFVTLELVARAPVAGSESRASMYYTLGAAVDDISDVNLRPADSPFGIGVNFSDPDDDSANTCANSL